MNVSNIITNLNEKSFTEKCSIINLSNDCISNNIATIDEENSKNIKDISKKSPSKSKKRKKKKKNRHIRIICRSKKMKKSRSDINRNSPKKENSPKKNKLSNGRELTKIYLAQLIKKKKMYSEKVKLMKLIKRNTSAKLKENSSLDVIKKYSQQVLNINRAAINIQKKRDEEKEKEKEKELLELLGIKIDDFSKNINISSIKLNTSTNERPKLLPSLLFKNNQIKINNLKNISTINSNKRYMNSQNAELRRCQSLGVEEFILKSKSSEKNINNNNNINSNHDNNNIIKIQINNISSKNINKEQWRSKSPGDTSQLNRDRIAKTRKEYQRQTVKESLKEFNMLYYSILPGNASYLVKNCMCHRTNWREAFSYATNLYNFRWQQLSYGIDYVGLGKYGAIKQVVNHYENHHSFSNKANMFINLMHYCEQRKLSVFKYAPFTIIFELKSDNKLNDEERQKLYEEKLEKLKTFIEKTGKYVKNYNDIGKYYKDIRFIEEKKNRIEFFKEKKPKRRGIFFSNNINEDYEEDIKEFNGKFKVYRDIFKKLKLIDRIPISNSADIYEKEKERKRKLEKTIGTNTVIEIPDTHYNGKNMWVIKAINLNRGMCIQIVNNYKQMCTVLNKFKEGVDYHFTEKVIEEENIPAEEKKEEKEKEKEKEEEKTKETKENQTNKKSEKEEENKISMY